MPGMPGADKPDLNDSPLDEKTRDILCAAHYCDLCANSPCHCPELVFQELHWNLYPLSDHVLKIVSKAVQVEQKRRKARALEEKTREVQQLLREINTPISTEPE